MKTEFKLDFSGSEKEATAQAEEQEAARVL